MDTDSIWKFMRFNTIREYCDRTPLPAPFCLISHFYLLLQQCSSKCCKQRSNQINSLSKSYNKVLQCMSFIKESFEILVSYNFCFPHALIPIVLVFDGIPVFLCNIQQVQYAAGFEKLMLLSLHVHINFRQNCMIVNTKIVVRKRNGSKLRWLTTP